MPDQLRQIVNVAKDMEDAAALYQRVLGIKATYHTRMDQFGLLKLVMPAGKKTFLEILQPVDASSNAGKFLEREGAYGGKFFSLITESRDLKALMARADDAGIKISYRSETACFLHPLGMTGVLIEVQQPPRGKWPNAGPEEGHRKPSGAVVTQLRQVMVLVHDLEDAIRRWTTVFGLREAARSYRKDEEVNTAMLAFGKTGTFVELWSAASLRSPMRQVQEQWKQVGGTGEGVYTAVFQVKELAAAEARSRQQGAEITRVEPPGGESRSLWLHPRSMYGALFQLTEVTSRTNPWPLAGNDWYK